MCHSDAKIKDKTEIYVTQLQLNYSSTMPAYQKQNDDLHKAQKP